MPFSPLSSLLFLFIYLGILTTETHSQITPSTSQYQGSPSFQDLIYDYGNIEFKFEEDLVLKDLVECTNDRVEATCAPCDYINFVDEDGTCVNPNVDIESTGVDCPCDATLCSSVLFFFSFLSYFQKINNFNLKESARAQSRETTSFHIYWLSRDIHAIQPRQ